MNKLGEILVRRKHLVHIEQSENRGLYKQTNIEQSLVVTMLKNIQSLGFTFSKDALEVLFNSTFSELEKFYMDLVPVLKKLVGADVVYNPMYPNFPMQVAEASDVELYLNAIIHYATFGKLLPEYEKNERLPLIYDDKMTVLSIGNHYDLMEIFKNLVNSKTSLSAQDKEDVRSIIENVPDFYDYLPDVIDLKENVAFIVKTILDIAPVKSSEPIQKYFKTATDVLRLVTALSDGDISLAKVTRFRSLKRYERRMVMDLLAGCGNIVEDIYRYPQHWIRIGEIVHPFEFDQPKYANVNRAFYTLRNEKKPIMFACMVQNAFNKGDTNTACRLLKQRPGEFARSLDKVLRDAANPSVVLDSFAKVADQVSSPVLLQVRSHFENRVKASRNPVRVFFPKGNIAKVSVIENNLPPISDSVSIEVVKICGDALIKKYSEKEKLGKVYVDPEFRQFVVPFSQRSASKAVKTFIRGSKIGVGKDANVIRAFIWWTNISGEEHEYFYDERVDIDLSAVAYDNNWSYMRHVSYTNLRDNEIGMYHSGDITNGGSVNGDGVAEFIDIDLEKARKSGIRYIVFQVYNFTTSKFSEMQNCRFGWMERKEAKSGEIFEPKTVEMKMDLTAESSVAIPVIFDCVDRKFIWCDMNLRASEHYGGNNLESNLIGATATCYAITKMNKPSMYDVVLLNAIARAESVVYDRNEADIIFSNDTTVPVEIVTEYDELTKTKKQVAREKDVKIITAFDTDYFVGQLL